jgi:hypothetical protein
LDRKALNRVRIQQDGGSSNQLAAPIRAEGTEKGGSKPHKRADSYTLRVTKIRYRNAAHALEKTDAFTLAQ